VVRTEGQPADWVGAVRGAVRSVDGNVPVAEVETLAEVVSLASSRTRFSLVLLGAFAGIALILAAVGLFGVMAYGVAQRTQEIGVRMALGARQGWIVRMVLRDGMTLAVAGLMAGGAAAFGLTRFIATQLYGVKPSDPSSFGLALVLLLGVAALAAYLPARRAAKVDPMVALRYE
jgi:putative ABC transport system permease protein